MWYNSSIEWNIISSRRWSFISCVRSEHVNLSGLQTNYLRDSIQVNIYLPVRRRATSARKSRWAMSQKTEAVTTYMILGSMTLVAGALKIPLATLKVWKASEWWKQLEADLRVQEDLQLSTRLKKIVERSYDVVEDRLENGDFVYDQRTGEMRRKPVAMRDAHKVAMDVGTRRDLLIDRHIANESITTDKIEETLRTLAEQFATIANQSKKPSPVIEVTDVIFGEDSNAPDERRKA